MKKEMKIIAEFPDYENALASDVDFNGHGLYGVNGSLQGFRGHISIKLYDNTTKEITGEHGVDDYEEEFGFTIVEKIVCEQSDYLELNGIQVDNGTIEISDVFSNDYPDFVDSFIENAEYIDGRPLCDEELIALKEQYPNVIQSIIMENNLWL